MMKPKVMRKRHTEAASPCPSDPKVGSTIRSRMYIVRVFVGDAEPPSRYTSVKIFRHPIVVRVATRNIMTLTPGTVTVKKRRMGPAPSSSAASYRDLSTFARADKYRIM